MTVNKTKLRALRYQHKQQVESCPTCGKWGIATSEKAFIKVIVK